MPVTASDHTSLKIITPLLRKKLHKRGNHSEEINVKFIEIQMNRHILNMPIYK